MLAAFVKIFLAAFQFIKKSAKVFSSYLSFPPKSLLTYFKNSNYSYQVNLNWSWVATNDSCL